MAVCLAFILLACNAPADSPITRIRPQTRRRLRLWSFGQRHVPFWPAVGVTLPCSDSEGEPQIKPSFSWNGDAAGTYSYAVPGHDSGYATDQFELTDYPLEIV
jgi:hypothetical protein